MYSNTSCRAAASRVRYQRIGDEACYAHALFEEEELLGDMKNMMTDTTKSVYEHVVYDSGVERTRAEQPEKNTLRRCS
ncbi:MAG: hypothetical protein R3D60_08435 [Paracoccaceae bacterium]